MNPSQLELDRNITTLRINSSELSKMSNQELIVLLNKTIKNIQGIAYYWATLSAEKKGILQKHKEGEGDSAGHAPPNNNMVNGN